MTTIQRLVPWMAVAAVMAVGATDASAQLDESCFVSVLNRNVQVNADGSWVLPNIPSSSGPVRARVTCTSNGQTVVGESDPFVVPVNGVVNVPPITFGTPTPIPLALALSAAATTLVDPGATTTLQTLARYLDGTTQDVTTAASGTTYRSSNPAVAAISADGVVTAGSTVGTAIVQATHEGAYGLLAIRVTSGSAPAGTIPESWSLQYGLNVQDPTMPFEDPDRDGLTNLEEYQLGSDPTRADSDADGLNDGDERSRATSPLLWDTDGDGISDGVEAQTGSDPLDPSSYNLATALTGIRVTPARFRINVSGLEGVGSLRLQVVGDLVDGRTIDVTSTQRRTSYTSNNLGSCQPGLPDGTVYGTTPGACTILVSNSGHETPVLGVVVNYRPEPVSYLPIPGYANGVDVEAGFAYVAAGAAGLQIVDVRNPAVPVIVGAYSTPASAQAVTVIGTTAFVAAAASGLVIIDVTDPQNPLLLGSLALSGDSRDLVVRDQIAYVSLGSLGIAVVSVSNPSSPQLLGSVDPPGTQRGIDVDPTRHLAVVASGTSGVHIIDVTNPAAPTIVGSTTGGDARAVKLASNYAIVADYAQSLTSIDITTATAPVVRASMALGIGGRLKDVAVVGGLAFGADVFFTNQVPITDIADPAAPLLRASVDFSALRDDDGTGIAVDADYVYLTAGLQSAFTEKRTTGDSRLYIGRYTAPVDDGSVVPAISITAPTSGSTAPENSQVTVRATATDDVGIAAVSFFINGQRTATLTLPPYEYQVQTPSGEGAVTIGATATDYSGNVTDATGVTVYTTVGTTLSTAARAFLPLPGYANGVDVNGNYAYVASGLAGLQIVNVANPAVPAVVGSLALAGKASAVVVSGTKAYVAAGWGGLQIVDVTDPSNPMLIGSLDTAGDARDLVVRNNVAYVANGEPGLVLIDVSLSSIPTVLGAIDLPGVQKGVDVDAVRHLAVVASGDAGVQIVDVSVPGTPALLASVALHDSRKPRLKDTWALVADEWDGVNSIDLANPAAPIVRAVSSGKVDIAFSQSIAIAAGSGMTLYEAAGPTSIIMRASIQPYTLGAPSYGTGIAVDATHAYMTVGDSFWVEKGDRARTATGLFIAQYRQPTDTAGVAPVVSIASPVNGTTVLQNATVTLRVSAVDDVAVSMVQFLVNGQSYASKTTLPYEQTVFVPPGATSLVLGASATDLGGNVGSAPNVTLTVLTDPMTTVVGRLVDGGGNSVPGMSVQAIVDATPGRWNSQAVISATDGTFSIPSVRTTGTVWVQVTQTGYAGSKCCFAPVQAGATDVGLVTVVGRSFVLSGRVLDGNGNPIAGASVGAFTPGASDYNYSDLYGSYALGHAVTDASGAFSFTPSPVQAGNTLVLRAQTSALWGKSAPILLPLLSAGITLPDIVMSTRVTTVVGRVVDGGGGGVAGLPVAAFAIYGQNGAQIGSGTTAADGSFSVPNVSGTDGDIVVRATDGVMAAPSTVHTPVLGGVTDVGTLTLDTMLSTCATAPTVSGLPYSALGIDLRLGITYQDGWFWFKHAFWYRVVAPAAGRLLVTADNAQAQRYDVNLLIASGPCGALTNVREDSGAELVQRVVAAGEEVYVAISTNYDGLRPVDLSIRLTPFTPVPDQPALTFVPEWGAEDALWLDRDSAAITGRRPLPVRSVSGTISAIAAIPSADRVAYATQHDWYEGDTAIVLQSRDWSQQTTVPIPSMYSVDPGFALAASATDFFTTSGRYVWQGGYSWKLESQIHRISAASGLTQTWTLPNSVPDLGNGDAGYQIGGLAVSASGSTAYHLGGWDWRHSYIDHAIHRYDLSTSQALPDLANDPNLIPRQVIALADGSVVTFWRAADMSGGALRRFDASGTLLNEYMLSGVPPFPASVWGVAPAIDPTHFWALDWGVDWNTPTAYEFDALTGTVMRSTPLSTTSDPAGLYPWDYENGAFYESWQPNP